MNFLNASRGFEKTLSPFESIRSFKSSFLPWHNCQQLNQTIEFDRKTKTITNSALANQLLKGYPPRNGWEQFYKMA